MLETLKLKYFQGKQYIPDIKNAPMREQFRGLPIIKNGNVDETICPTGAIKTNPLSIKSCFRQKYTVGTVVLDSPPLNDSKSKLKKD